MEKQIKKLITGTCEECGSPIVRDLYGESFRTECVRCGTISSVEGKKIEVTAECRNCLYSIKAGHLYHLECAVNPPFGHHGDFPMVSPDDWCSHHDFDPFRVMGGD